MQEYLETKKYSIIASNYGDIPASYNIQMSDLPQELTTKYGNKFEILPDGELYYKSSALTEQEIQWCQDLGIQGNPGFQEYVNILRNKYYDESAVLIEGAESTGVMDLRGIHNELKDKYPDAVFSYMTMADNDVKYPEDLWSSREYNMYVETMEKLSEVHEYVKGLGKSNIQESDLTPRILELVNDLEIELPTTEGEIAVKRAAILLVTSSIQLNVFYNNEHVYIGINPEIEEIYKEAYENVNLDFELVSKEDAEEVLIFDDYYSDDNIGSEAYLKVVGYKENSSNITVPAYVVNSDNELQAVIEIAPGAFSIDSTVAETKPGKFDIIELIQIEKYMEVDSYTELSLDQIKAYMPAVTGGLSDTIKDNYVEDTLENKNTFIMESLGLIMGITKDNLDKYFIQENGRIYAILTLDADGAPTNVYQTKDENGNLIEIDYIQYLENLTIQEGIIKIGERAFAGNMLHAMYFPTTIEDATNAFTGIRVIRSIYTKLTSDQVNKIKGANGGYNQFGLDGYFSDYAEYMN